MVFILYVSLQMSESRQIEVSDSFTVVSSLESLQRDDEHSASVQQQQQQVSDDEPEDIALTNDLRGKHYSLRCQLCLWIIHYICKVQFFL